MSDSEETEDEVSVAEMEEKLEARLMERVMKKVNEQLAGEPATSDFKGSRKNCQCSRR